MRKIDSFKQTRVGPLALKTCGIACIMVALSAFHRNYPTDASAVSFMRTRVDYPDAANEARLYGKFGAKTTDGTTGGAIACALVQSPARQGSEDIRVTLLHESPEMMENRAGYFPEEPGRRYFNDRTHQGLLEEHAAWIRRAGGRLCVRTGETITAASLAEKLRQSPDCLLITHTLIDGVDGIHNRVTHWVILYGYDAPKDEFLVYDPLSGKIRLSRTELESCLDTPFGRCCIIAEADAGRP